MQGTRRSAVLLLVAGISVVFCWSESHVAFAQSVNAKPSEGLKGPTAAQLKEVKKELMKVGNYSHFVAKQQPGNRELHTFVLNDATDAGFKEFPDIPFEFAAHVRKGQLTEAGLKVMARNTNLTGLYFSNTKLTDAGLKELKTLTNLTYLDVSEQKITSDILNEWKTLTKLDTLLVDQSGITDDVLKTLLDNGQFHRLGLAIGFTIAKGETRPTSVADVIRIDLSRTTVTPAGLKLLKGFASLNCILLNGDVTFDEEVSALKEVGLLHAWGYAIGKNGKRPTKPEEVDTIQIAGSGFTDVGLNELKAFKNISRINLSGTKVTAAGLSGLKGLESLRELGLSDGPKIGPWVKELKALNALGISCSSVTDETIRTLREYGRLHLLWTATAPYKGDGRVRSDAEITHLNVSQFRISSAGLKELKGLTGLRKLSLHRDQFTDEGVKVLREAGVLYALGSGPDGRFPTAAADVTHFILSDSGVTEIGIQELKDFKNLNTLGLRPNQITDGSIRSLREMGLLHSLIRAVGPDGKRPTTPGDVTKLAINGISDRGLKELGVFTNLTSLDLRQTRVTDAGIKELKVFKKLTRLDLNGVAVTNAGLKELRELKSLAVLDLRGTRITGAGLSELKGMTSITTLTLPDELLADDVLKGLREAGLLHTLSYLAGPNGSRPKSAEEVTAFSPPVDGQSTADLISAGQFRKGVSDAGLKELVTCSNLSFLNLEATRVTDAGLKELKGLKKLTHIDLVNTKVTADGMKELKAIDSLRSLVLHPDRVTDEVLKELRVSGRLYALTSGQPGERYASNEDVKHFSVSHFKITDAGLKELAVFKNLSSLDLSYTQVTDEGLKSLHQFEKLSYVNTLVTRITGEGKKALKAALPNCKTE